MQKALTNEVKSLLSTDSTAELHITGHSLGGSLAVLCATQFARVENVTVVGVYTFGASRVGNAEFHAFYSQGTHTSWRVTHWKDPVPHLPMTSLGFHHVPNEVFYNKDSSSYAICDASGEDPHCSNSVAWDSLLFVNEHYTYIKADITDCSLLNGARERTTPWQM